MRDIILFEGNNEPNKGINDSIRITEGMNRAWLGRETHPVDNCILFTNPPQEDIPKIYQRSKILLKTSKSEGFGLPHLEGMASGCVLVTYDSGGNMDFCIDRYNCRIVTKETARQVIDELLKDPEQMKVLQENGYKTSQDFHWETQINKLEKFYAYRNN